MSIDHQYYKVNTEIVLNSCIHVISNVSPADIVSHAGRQFISYQQKQGLKAKAQT